VFLSFPPLDLWPLAFVALVPLMLAVQQTLSWRGAAAAGTAAAAAALPAAFAWVAGVAVPGWLVLSAYTGTYLVVFAVGLRALQRRLPACWPVPAACLWAGLDLVRARLGPGFPWLFVGYTQYRFLPLAQWAAWAGVYGVTFIVVLANAWVAATVARVTSPGATRPPARRTLAPAAAALVLVCAAAVMGAAWMRGVRLHAGPVVGVVQQNYPRTVAEVFGAADESDVYAQMDQELRVAAELSLGLKPHGPRLICWPESTVQLPLNVAPRLFARERERQVVEDVMEWVRRIGAETQAHVLVGGPTYFPPSAGYVESLESLRYGLDVTDFGNSVVHFDAAGRFLGRYDKIKLVPFGEYIPLRKHLPFLQALTPISRENTPGREYVVFDLPGRAGTDPVRFAALICYEDVFPRLPAEFRKRGADFLVNATYEGWYQIPGELGQHLAMAVFRAIETRTTVVRAANTGVSCFIDPVGRVYADLEPWTRGALARPVLLADAAGPYVRYGDWFAVLCLACAVALPVAVNLARRRAVRGRLVEPPPVAPGASGRRPSRRGRGRTDPRDTPR
jgi:apolipoprotein N-acyltransferase